MLWLYPALCPVPSADQHDVFSQFRPCHFQVRVYISQFCSLVFFYILFFLLSFLVLCSLEFWDCCYLLLSLSFPLILFALIFVYYYINFILKKMKLLHFKTCALISVYSVKDCRGFEVENTTVWLFPLWFWRCTFALPLGPGGWDGVRGGGSEGWGCYLCAHRAPWDFLCVLSSPCGFLKQPLYWVW